jgi:hypothetical protein
MASDSSKILYKQVRILDAIARTETLADVLVSNGTVEIVTDPQAENEAEIGDQLLAVGVHGRCCNAS